MLVEITLQKIEKQEHEQRNAKIASEISLMVEQAAMLGQETLDEQERIRQRQEQKAEFARINMIFSTYEQQRVTAK